MKSRFFSDKLWHFFWCKLLLIYKSGLYQNATSTMVASVASSSVYRENQENTHTHTHVVYPHESPRSQKEAKYYISVNFGWIFSALTLLQSAYPAPLEALIRSSKGFSLMNHLDWSAMAGFQKVGWGWQKHNFAWVSLAVSEIIAFKRWNLTNSCELWLPWALFLETLSRKGPGAKSRLDWVFPNNVVDNSFRMVSAGKKNSCFTNASRQLHLRCWPCVNHLEKVPLVTWQFNKSNTCTNTGSSPLDTWRANEEKSMIPIQLAYKYHPYHTKNSLDYMENYIISGKNHPLQQATPVRSMMPPRYSIKRMSKFRPLTAWSNGSKMGVLIIGVPEKNKQYRSINFIYSIK